jgi:hypothetical protein
LIPARAGLNAVADPRGRNLQNGTVILNFERLYLRMSNIKVAVIAAALSASIGCGASGTSNSNVNANANVAKEIVLDPNNLPEGLSATPLPINANGKLPEGISINGAPPSPGRTPTPGIPNSEQLKKGVKHGKIPGIDPDAARKQLGYPPANAANKQ